MNGIPYKRYLIRPAPLQLADSDEWNLELYIGKDRDGAITWRKFSAANTFKTKEEAVKHCINFGKRVIDGEVENCTVTDI